VCSGSDLGSVGSVLLCVFRRAKGKYDHLSRNCSVASGAEAMCSELIKIIILLFGLAALV
jgi:hypothetical protein